MGDWNLLELWRSMGTLCHGVVIVLAIMFARSVGVSASRALRYRLAREQSKTYIVETLDSFRDGKLDQAIVAAEDNKRSHIASVVAQACWIFRRRQKACPNSR
jgi:hypothetical protein